MSEVCEAEVPFGVDFAIEHGCNLSGLFGLAHAEGVARGDGLGHAEVEILKEPGRGFAVAVQLGEHQGVEGVVHGGRDFCGDDAVALGVDDEDSCGGVELAEIFGDADLLGAPGEAVFGFHDGAEVGAGVEPLDVIVDGVADGRARRQRLEELDGKALGALNACIDVVTLLEIDVLEEVSSDGSGGSGEAKHLDARKVRNRTLDGHEALAEVLIDRGNVGVLWHGRD